MASELLLLAPPPPIVSTATSTSTAADGTTTTITVSTAAANGTTTTITTSTTSTGTTISSLSGDDLREIFLRLPDLPALVRAALTCRSWLAAVRSSPPFRSLFRALHPAPLIGTFLQLVGATYPIFAPLRLSGDTDVTAILHHGDFLLTSLPHSPFGWTVADCRDGCILLYNNEASLAILNPMTWAVDILPLPPLECIDAGSSDGGSAFPAVYLDFSDEKPCLFRVIYVCQDQQQPRVRFATFSSKTWDWDIHPWVDIGGDISLVYKAGSLVDGTVYWPCHGEGRMIRIDINTLDITVVDLPGQVEVDVHNFKAGETKDGELCIVYESDSSLSVWILRIDSDGTEIWEGWDTIPFAAAIDGMTEGITQDMHSIIDIEQVRCGYVYMSRTCITLEGTRQCWFFSLSLETLELDLLHQGSYDGYVHPFVMAWPSSLVADDGEHWT